MEEQTPVFPDSLGSGEYHRYDNSLFVSVYVKDPAKETYLFGKELNSTGEETEVRVPAFKRITDRHDSRLPIIRGYFETARVREYLCDERGVIYEYVDIPLMDRRYDAIAPVSTSLRVGQAELLRRAMNDPLIDLPLITIDMRNMTRPDMGDEVWRPIFDPSRPEAVKPAADAPVEP